MVPDYEAEAVSWMDTAGEDHETAMRSLARAQVYATLALRQAVADLVLGLDEIKVVAETQRDLVDVKTEAGKWLLEEYARTPGDPKWFPGMGLESTIIAIEAQAAAPCDRPHRRIARLPPGIPTCPICLYRNPGAEPGDTRPVGDHDCEADDE